MIMLAASLAAQERQPPEIHQSVMSAESALTELFGPPAVARCDTVFVDTELAQAFQDHSGMPLNEHSFEIMTISEDNVVVGYAAIGAEVGKFYPITFIVGVDTEYRVVGVRVLVYRESHGGDVKRGRFLRQYRGKDLGDPIAINRDIINISGATLSVGALNRGVRKVLFMLQAFRNMQS